MKTTRQPHTNSVALDYFIKNRTANSVDYFLQTPEGREEYVAKMALLASGNIHTGIFIGEKVAKKFGGVVGPRPLNPPGYTTAISSRGEYRHIPKLGYANPKATPSAKFGASLAPGREAAQPRRAKQTTQLEFC